MGTMMRDGELPAWPEVQRLLHNESIPLEQRRTLALRYFSNVEVDDDRAPGMDWAFDEPTDYGFESQEQFENIREKTKKELGVSGRNADDDDGDVMEAYTAAHETRDRLQKKQLDDLDKAVQGAKEKLGSLEKSASDTSVSASDSDEILALGRHTLKEISLLMPVYSRAISILGEGRKTLSMEDVDKRYYEQAGIPFDKFATVADDIDKLREAVSECWADQSSRMSPVLSNWAGAGQESAAQSWQGVREGKDKIEESLDGSSQGIVRATAAVAKSCRDKVGWMLEYRTSAEYGAAYPYFDLERLCDIAELARVASDNDLLHFVDRMPPYLASEIQGESGDLEAEHKDAAAEWAKRVLGGFTKWFGQYTNDFSKMCDNELSRVNGIWDKLNEKLSEAPTDSVSRDPEDADSGATDSGSSGGPNDQGAQGAERSTMTSPGSAPVGPGSSAGSSAGSGGGHEPGGGGHESSGTNKAGVRSEDVNPVAGNARATNPGTGAAYPINPETGEAVTDPGDEQRTVTITHGDKEISLSRSNGDGEMTITVDDGTGAPATFELDFAGEKPDDQAVEQPNEQPAGRTDERAGERLSERGTGDASSSGDSVEQRRDGSAPREGSEDEPAVHRPSPDGAVHVAEGGLNITAERPEGPEGATVVTVDDGTGEPTTYTLGSGTEGTLSPRTPDSPEEVAGENSANRSTTTQAWFGDVFDGAGAGMDVGGGADSATTSTFGEEAQAGSAASAEGSAGLGSAPGGGGAHSGNGASDTDSGAARGAGVLEGGMAGAGGAAGGDEQRDPDEFSVNFGLFDVGETGGRISGSLGESADGEVMERG